MVPVQGFTQEITGVLLGWSSLYPSHALAREGSSTDVRGNLGSRE